MNKVIHELASDPNPQNRYQIAQLVTFAVDDLVKPMNNWVDLVADHKRVGASEEAAFRVNQKHIRAFIQAKGATTPRSKVADKEIVVDTVAVSVRPAVNLVELAAGKVNMGDLVAEAAIAMDNKKTAYIYNLLDTAAQTWNSPFYGSGAGIVKATLNPMMQHWMRLGGCALLGDVYITSKLAEQTGFTAAVSTQQFGNGIIEEYNRTGKIGTYYGAPVIQMVNPYEEDGITPMLAIKRLWLLPTGATAEARSLKVVDQGDVISVENTAINDLTYEIRMDQHFGAAIVIGDTPAIGMYKDTTA